MADHCEDCPIVNLIDTESPEGFVCQSWMDDEFVQVAFGLVTLSIPKTEWVAFSKFIADTQIKKHAIDQLKDIKGMN